jgi:hypothetical protein
MDPGDPLGGVAVDDDLAGLGPMVVEGDGQPVGEAAFDQIARHGVLLGLGFAVADEPAPEWTHVVLQAWSASPALSGFTS